MFFFFPFPIIFCFCFCFLNLLVRHATFATFVSFNAGFILGAYVAFFFLHQISRSSDLTSRRETALQNMTTITLVSRVFCNYFEAKSLTVIFIACFCCLLLAFSRRSVSWGAARKIIGEKIREKRGEKKLPQLASFRFPSLRFSPILSLAVFLAAPQLLSWKRLFYFARLVT